MADGPFDANFGGPRSFDNESVERQRVAGGIPRSYLAEYREKRKAENDLKGIVDLDRSMGSLRQEVASLRGDIQDNTKSSRQQMARNNNVSGAFMDQQIQSSMKSIERQSSINTVATQSVSKSVDQLNGTMNNMSSATNDLSETTALLRDSVTSLDETNAKSSDNLKRMVGAIGTASTSMASLAVAGGSVAGRGAIGAGRTIGRGMYNVAAGPARFGSRMYSEYAGTSNLPSAGVGEELGEYWNSMKALLGMGILGGGPMDHMLVLLHGKVHLRLLD